MPHVDLPTGARLHYEDWGSGTPVLLIHGWLETPAHDLPDLLDWLAADYRVLAPTRRGYGDSHPKPRAYPNDFYHQDAADMLAFLDALNVPRAHVLGFSDGGETALIVAGTAPQRVISVTAWGAVGYFGPAMRAAIQRSYPAPWLENDAELKARHGIADGNAYALMWIRAVKHMIDSGGDVSLSLAPNITAPLLLLLGEEDRLNPAEYGQRYVEAARNGRLMMFSGGHSVHREHPDEFRRVVGDFMRAAE